jgi:hypothetical protein
MTDYTIINGTNAELTNVNAANQDIAAKSLSHGVALDGTELATVIALGGVAVMKTAPTYEQKRGVAQVARYRLSSAQ